MADKKLNSGGGRTLPDSEEDREALRLAETTDLSENQARELIRKHGKGSPEIEKEARNFKAEG